MLVEGTSETAYSRVERLVLEYAQNAPPRLPLNSSLSLQSDLGIESLSLVSLTMRLGEELGVDDVSALDLEIGKLRTVGDLVAVAKRISQHSTAVNRAE